jgi:NRAMP (natural resistance-associated macrophage protein)-like metal ion transporter
VLNGEETAASMDVSTKQRNRGEIVAEPSERVNSDLDTPAPGTGAREFVINRERNPLKRALMVLGPGVITGASDDDPSGVGTYAVAGASLGFATLWTTLLTLPMMMATQFISAKVGMVTGKGLTGVLRQHYPRSILYPAVMGLVIANTINAGADVGAIAAAMNLLVPVPIVVWIVPTVLVILALQIWGSYRLIATVFKWITLALLAYIGAALFAKPHLTEVLRGTFIPTFRFDRAFLAVFIALLGTTISPYMWFWQASEEVEELVALGQRRLWQRKGATDAELTYAAWDVNVGMVFSNLVAYFIILTTAATLFTAGKTDIKSAADAAEALRPFVGNGARALFALGLIGAGFLAVPILTGSAAYAVADAFGWKSGLDQKPRGAKQFYAVIAGTTLVGMVINFVGINPIDALFWTAIINGFLTPPLLVLLMLISNNHRIMGDRVNGWPLNLAGWFTAAIMSGALIAFIATWGKS